ncbi:glycerophosphodiester phosphodiesterase [Bacillus sp. S/N-304-OC-R1]|uniref:glycerophosphodiester phosphodiesterase n=1 Tax=Bacillus sp. S/N-304-OC-R1 TaxID=2758034 RepID=UPI001C8DB17C|nr:glycerophosphodiester phosphodiesterase [Bacillus sp. S/N-304-OC-R1]MBY0123524.1 glycerophosphodiester phosphodiesterase [Bacillus sp. S/N-304-OC-R1]
MNNTLIFAHRGSKGTHPENTLSAFKEAVRLGVDGIELDVHLTKDGEVVVIHDETVDRTTNGNGKVQDFTLAELQKLDAGSWFSKDFTGEKIPTLNEVLDLLKDTEIVLNVEIKNDVIPYIGIEEKVLTIIDAYNYNNKTIISSFNHYCVKKVHQLNPSIETAILFMELLYEPWNYAKSLGASGLHVYVPVSFTDMSKESTKMGFPVRVFTVNEEIQMNQLIDLKIDTIMTDYPEKALKLRDSMVKK